LIVAAVILLVSGYRPFPPSVLGKFTTATQILLVFTLVLSIAYPDLQLASFIRVLIWAVTSLCVISGFHYSFSMAHRLSTSTPEAK